jgi:hypothetical protein
MGGVFMANDQDKQQKSGDQSSNVAPAQPAGDNRRAGDTDGNLSGGNSKSKGATNPADQPPQPEKNRK